MVEKDSWGLPLPLVASVTLASPVTSVALIFSITPAAVLHGHADTILQLFESLDCNHVSLIEPLYGCCVTVGRSDRNRLYRGRIVRFNHINESALGIALDRRRGDQDGVMCRVYQESGIHKLIGKKRIVLIRENGLELQGSRCGVDLVV